LKYTQVNRVQEGESIGLDLIEELSRNIFEVNIRCAVSVTAVQRCRIDQETGAVANFISFDINLSMRLPSFTRLAPL
jgi:hypothetical protein